MFNKENNPKSNPHYAAITKVGRQQSSYMSLMINIARLSNSKDSWYKRMKMEKLITEKARLEALGCN